MGCPLCRSGADETEQHLYLTCNTILQTNSTLQQFIQAGTIHNVDIDKAITLNIIPDSINKKQQTISLRILSQYRKHIWHHRLKAFFNNHNYTNITLEHIFRQTIQKMIENLQDNN